MASTSLHKGDLQAFYTYAALIVCSVLIAMFTKVYVFAAAPLALLAILTIVKDIRVLYYGFFALLPFSVEVELGPIGTDLPSEPMMLGLTAIAIILFLKNLANIPKKVVYHSISLMLVLHVGWIFVTAMFSQFPIFSFKFLLAKLWYIIPFYFLGFYLLQSDKDIWKLFKYAGTMLTVAVGIVLIRHARLDFTFDTSNEVVYPIFRNHVNYAAMIVAVIPYMWALWAKERKSWQVVAIVILLLGTYFSYTRAAHLCIFIMIGAYFVFKYKLGKIALTSSAIGMILLSIFLIQGNKYLDFAPDFSKTISHDKFGNLVEATYKLEDISTMERVYRWVAGGHMIVEKPILGYGPSGFYHNYTSFTVRSFETYVSNNPEKSGIHNYYLMTWVEQGIIGLLIFLAICSLIVLVGEKAYHHVNGKEDKLIVMACTLSTISICALLLINDLIEADKVGPFFFLNAGIIALYDLKSRSLSKQ